MVNTKTALKCHIQAFRIGFGDFFEAIDEPEEHATFYAVLADILSMAVFSVSILLGYALPRINQPAAKWLNNDHRWPFGKLIVVSIGALSSLLSIVGFGRPSREGLSASEKIYRRCTAENGPL